MDEDFGQEYLLMVEIERRLLWRLGFGFRISYFLKYWHGV